jgi:transcriptional regulator with AAA-type ATPase domain
MARHPFIRAWLAGEGSDWPDLRHHLDPAEPLDREVAAAIDTLWAGGDGAAVLRASTRTADDASDLAVLGMLIQAVLAARNGLVQAGESLLRRAMPLVAGRPPAFCAYALSVQGMLRHPPGSDGRIRASEEALAALPAGDPRWPVQAFPLGFHLARSGRLHRFARQRSRLGRLPASASLPGPAVLDLVDACERGDWEAAGRAWPTVARDLDRLPEMQADLRRLFTGYGRLLAVVTATNGAPESANDPVPVQILRFVQHGDPVRALALAKADPAGPAAGPGLLEAGLVRAELAMANGGAALRLLAIRRERGCRTLGEDLLWAQAHWLAGDAAAARRAVHAARQEADEGDAAGRLTLEWDLAVGLPRSAVADLARPLPAREARIRAAPAEDPAATVLIGRSPALTAVRRSIARFAPESAPVLITGETGTGKELVARLLHARSPRADRPFIAVNAAALGESLIESELFGHERGSFSGATAAHPGWFEQAGDGTLFLDEIGDIPARLQAALLRVLETDDFRRVGAERGRTARCRLIAATHRDLGAEAAAGRFRPDLLYRLQRLAIHVPALRERPEDIPDIALHLLRRDSPEPDRVRLDPGLVAALARRPWPGNVRELRNELERMRILASESGEYGVEDLPAPPPAVRATAGERRERLRRLAREQGRIRRVDCMRLLGVSQQTATADLRALIDAGCLVKRMPTPAPRSHYFEPV